MDRYASAVPLFPDVCVYHRDDDGFGAAWVVHSFRNNFSPEKEIDFYSIQYGEPFDLERCRGAHVLMVDFSLKRGPMIDLMLAADTLRVLDHHKTAEFELVSLTDGKSPRVDIEFDMKRSGVLMTLDLYQNFPGTPEDYQPPELIDYLDAGDLGHFERRHDLLNVQAAVRSHPYSLPLWDYLMTPEGLNQLREEGVAIRRFFKAKVEAVLDTRHFITLPGGEGLLACNCPYFMASAVAGELCAGPDRVGAAYWHDGRAWNFSVRARDGFDASALAKSYGGGGHEPAADFQITEDFQRDPLV